MAQVDPVDYGLLERKGREMVLAPQPAEQWVTHLADMNWPYAMGAAHLFTYPLLQELARSEYRLADEDLTGRPFNQLKNYVWSQLGQIALYEILVREGSDEARRIVKRLVIKWPFFVRGLAVAPFLSLAPRRPAKRVATVQCQP